MTQIDAHGAYNLYHALKLHFTTTSFDAIKYNFKVKTDFEKFRHKPQAVWFNQLAKKHSKEELIEAFVANFITGDKWGGLYGGVMAFDKVYDAWRAKKEALSYTFTSDLENVYNVCLNLGIDEPIMADLFTVTGSYPRAVTLWLQKEITLETVVILDTLTGFVLKCNKTVKETIVWPKHRQTIQKYQPFLVFDKPKFKTILLNQFPLKGTK